MILASSLWRTGLLAAALLASACGGTGRAAEAKGASDLRLIPDEPAPGQPDAATEANPCLEAAGCSRTFSHRGRRFDYHGSHSLFRPNASVQRAVVLVHGLDGSSAVYFETLVASARRAGVAPQTTLLIAPQFLGEDRAREAAADHHVWTRTGWTGGDKSVSKPRVSSYEIIDGIVGELLREGRFPNLRTIIIGGHSSGGQLTQRYAAVSRAEDDLARPRGVRLRYVVANPSSYLYLGETRPFFTRGTTGFGLPYRGSKGATTPQFEGAPVCPKKYDEYKYGLDDLNAYAEKAGEERIVRQYPRREVVYLAGQYDSIELDCASLQPPPDAAQGSGDFASCRGFASSAHQVAPCWCQSIVKKNLADLDRSCPAALQGVDRKARAFNYFHYLNTYHRGHRHRLLEVPFAHHSGRLMFDSPIGAGVLFLEP